MGNTHSFGCLINGNKATKAQAIDTIDNHETSGNPMIFNSLVEPPIADPIMVTPKNNALDISSQSEPK